MMSRMARFLGILCFALATGLAQQPNPKLAKDPGPFLPGFGAEQDRVPKTGGWARAAFS